jgi:hypothetical protein
MRDSLLAAAVMTTLIGARCSSASSHTPNGELRLPAGRCSDGGSRSAYTVVRAELDRLNLPWCAIIGDHDVHEKCFANFLEAMSERTQYAFTVGYNEIANDGQALYSATRSKGQIEGPVGYSVTNIDGDVVSWRFIELGKLPVVVITSPSDERLLTKSSEIAQGSRRR